MRNHEVNTKFILLLAIIATPLAAGAFLLSWQPSNHFFDFSPTNDGFVMPRDISKTIDKTQESTISVSCSVNKDDSWFGTGWAIDAELLQVVSKKTTVITNFHVIEDCIDGRGNVTIAQLYKSEKPAQILVVDKEADLAILTTDVKLKPLELSAGTPWPGYWVMALGSADSYQGSVAFGNVLNVTVKDILITNNISEGNSGGPLVDNEGKVVGIVTWGMNYKKRQYNGARILDVFCQKILKCQYEFEGDKTWFDYND